MRNSKGLKLSPSQHQAYEGLKRGLEIGSIFRLWSAVGRGKSTILKKLQEETGAAFVDLRAFLEQAVGGGEHDVRFDQGRGAGGGRRDCVQPADRRRPR